MTVVRRIAPDDRRALAACLAVVAAVDPRAARTVEEVLHDARTYDPDERWFAAVEGGEVVGAASIGRIRSVEDPDALWAGVWVLSRARRRGAGRALLAAVSGRAAACGRTALRGLVDTADPDGEPFVRRRGFVAVERVVDLVLDLRGPAPPPAPTPEGIRIVTLAERPDLGPALLDVHVEADADIPGTDARVVRPTLDEFLHGHLGGPAGRPDGVFIALGPDGAPVGYANVEVLPARPGVGYHGMTGLRRAWRGRGVGSALKRATIAWAVGAGLTSLETSNNEENAPMRALNARLGYRPLAPVLVVRGPAEATAAPVHWAACPRS